MITNQTFKTIYDDFLESGLSIRSFCSNHAMNEAKFYYWQRKLQNHLPDKKGFVPLIIGKDRFEPQSVKPRAFSRQTGTIKETLCEIAYPNGVVLKLSGEADLEMIRSLLLMR